MNKNFLYNMFIWTFGLLYVITAFISFYHAIEFFSIGNVGWMSVLLAAVFEIGQATVLASLLLSDNNKVIMPWILMVVLTTVQVIGNVYSVFKYMSESVVNYYQYLEKPLLFWVDGLSQDTVMVIISYIIGALLPIVALCMTTMVANNIKMKNEANDKTMNIDNIENNDDKEKEIITPIVKNEEIEITEPTTEENNNTEKDIINEQQEKMNNDIIENNDIRDTELDIPDISINNESDVPEKHPETPKHRIRSVEFGNQI